METRGRSLLGWRFRLGVLGLALCTLACDSDRERFEGHLERAAAFAQAPDPGPASAILELQNALQIERGRPEVHHQLAELLRAELRLPDAIFYYEEALHLDPEKHDSAVQLARLLLDRDPGRAKTLIAGVMERAPASGLPFAVRAELNLGRGDREAALADARQSVALEPDTSLGYWVLAEALYARSLEAKRAGAPIDRGDIDEGLEALDRYTEFSGEADPWSALAPRARFLALQPIRFAEANLAWRQLMEETAPDKAPAYIAQRGAQAALDLGREWGIDPYRLQALERLIELNPRNMGYWDELAGLRESLERSGKRTLDKLIETNPGNPEAHLRYVSYLRATEGRRAAIAHLLQHVDDEELGPDMLGALGALYKQAGETGEAKRVVETLIEEFPWHPVTLLVQGREALARGDSEAASVLLRSLLEDSQNAEPASLLAHAEMARRDYPAALDAIARAIEIDPSQRDPLLPLRAHAYVEMNQCEHAVGPYARLYSKERLNADEKVAFARCLYTTGDSKYGLQLLLETIREGDPAHKALFELTRREEANPVLQHRIRSRLQAAEAADPQNVRIATHLSALDRRLDRSQEALARLDAYRERGLSDPEARLLRARLLFEAGDLAAARPELEELFRTRPYLEGILPLLVSSLLAGGDTPAALAALQRGERFSLLGPERYVLYATLLLDQDDRSGALRALEHAYLGGVQDPKVMIQLTLLQLREGNDLEKAANFARLAVNWSQRSPEALNAAGLVLLEMGHPEIAVVRFEEALAAGGDANLALQAGTHYRLALALHRSDRADEAAPHFQRAHALDARIPAGPPSPGRAESPR